MWRWLRLRPRPRLRRNSPPATESDFYRMPSTQTSLIVPAPGVLANDTDPDGDPLTAELLSGADVRQPSTCAATAASPTRRRPASAASTSFAYLARDTPARRASAAGTSYIIVTRPPQAADDSYAAISGVRRIVDRARACSPTTSPIARGSAIRPTTGACVAAHRRALRLHVGSRLRRHRHLHLRGGRPRRAAGDGDRDHAGQASNVAAGRRRRHLPDAGGRRGDRGRARRARQRPRRRRRSARPRSSSTSPAGRTPSASGPTARSSTTRRSTTTARDASPTGSTTGSCSAPRSRSRSTSARSTTRRSPRRTTTTSAAAATLDIPAPGVLANDFDEVEGDALSARLRGNGTAQGHARP